MMLDYQYRIILVNQTLKHIDQLVDVGGVQPN